MRTSAHRAPFGARPPPIPAVLPRPLPLRKVEGELRGRLIVPDVVGRIASAGDGRGIGQQPQVREDALHGLALGDDGDDRQPAVTLGTFENVHGETPAEQRRPVDAGLHRVEQPPKQPIPVFDRDDVRRELDHVAGTRRAQDGGGHPEVACPREREVDGLAGRRMSPGARGERLDAHLELAVVGGGGQEGAEDLKA